MKQLLFVHGWNLLENDDELIKAIESREINPFEEKKRRRMTMEKYLPEFQVIKPEMPNKDMARYKVWKCYFEKHLPFLNGDEIVLIWHSLWALFLLKYVGENKLPFKIRQLHIISPVFNSEWLNEWDNYLWDFEYNPEILKTIAEKAENIRIWHSKDDKVVPFNHSEKIVQFIPWVHFEIFQDRGHFNQETFPELIEKIKEN